MARFDRCFAGGCVVWSAAGRTVGRESDQAGPPATIGAHRPIAALFDRNELSLS